MEITNIPQYGFCVKFDHKFPEKAKPFTSPRLKQILPVFSLSMRYFKYWFKLRRRGIKMYIDNIKMVPWKPIYGVPIGGIGSGSIGRGFKGEFCRYHMVPGMYKHHVVQANQFILCVRKDNKTIYQQVLSPHKPPKKKVLGSWKWSFPAKDASYTGLYPRSWTVYEIPHLNLRLICRQISPIIPENYKDSCLPGAVFVWTIENNSGEDYDVSIMFTFKNGLGGRTDKSGGCWTEPFTFDPKSESEPVSSDESMISQAESESTPTASSNLASSAPPPSSTGDMTETVTGVSINQRFRDMKCVYAISAKHRDDVSVSYCSSFDPSGSGADIWNDLHEDGLLDSSKLEASAKTVKGTDIGAAVCSKCHVLSNQSKSLEFSLTWDQPIIHFGTKKQFYTKRYIRWFGSDCNASPRLASYFLSNYQWWEEKIFQWQQPILSNPQLPDWYKSALFNELYYISDGGTVWCDVLQHNTTSSSAVNSTAAVISSSEHGPSMTTAGGKLHPLVVEYGKFAYLEGHEYRMYNTYDVHYYASFALLMLWHKLQLSLQHEFAEAILREDNTPTYYIFNGDRGVRKTANCVPHDMGDPEFDPWLNLNGYVMTRTDDWKDLNVKFVLQVFRDYRALGNLSYLRDTYQSAKAVMGECLKFDRDDDGVIDNAGYGDQTYDAWVMAGASAYCGGLWLSALAAMCEMSKALGKTDDCEYYEEILAKGKASYEKKLWNGRYYNFDSSSTNYHNSIMADQLCGHWFLKASNVPDDTVLPKEHVLKTLETIYQYNVLSFRKGTMGCANGVLPNGKLDTTSIQSEEFWTGVAYGLSALMIHEGMVKNGFSLAEGVYRHCYERLGLGFQTPEAYTVSNAFRSLGYMRPLAIWAIQWALEKTQVDLSQLDGNANPVSDDVAADITIPNEPPATAAAPGPTAGLPSGSNEESPLLHNIENYATAAAEVIMPSEQID